MYKVPYSPGGSLSSCEEGEEYNVEKMERGSIIIHPFNLEAVDKNIKRGRGEGD